ncbi:MAG: YfcE family phosphodiesterase [Lactobacillaceae bacterium]|jgi:putative phosphoesterase|nr:YfcE family phosphodiesterase [Lactobacillaceae bacterium]
MKYLIFSDAHLDRKEFEFIVDKYKDDTDVVARFYNGDSQFEARDPIFEGLTTVVGNMDFDQPFNIENVYHSNQDDITFYQTHGHLYRADYNLDTLWEQANKFNAEIVLFGHTHEVVSEIYKGKLFINPGSISNPRGPQAFLGGTYVVLNVTNEAFEVDYFGRAGEKISSISKIFERKNTL